MTQTYYRGNTGKHKWHLLQKTREPIGLAMATICGLWLLPDDERFTQTTTIPKPSEVCRRCDRKRKSQ